MGGGEVGGRVGGGLEYHISTVSRAISNTFKRIPSEAMPEGVFLSTLILL
jgi:hypothetical protein